MTRRHSKNEPQPVPRAVAELVIVVAVGVVMVTMFVIDLVRGTAPRNALADVAGSVLAGGLWVYTLRFQVHKLRRSRRVRTEK